MASLGSALLLAILASISTNDVVGTVTVESMDCKFSPAVCSSSYCILTKPRGTVAYLSASCYMEKPLDVVWMHAEVLQKVARHNRNTGLKIVQDVCKFSDFQSGNPFLSSIMSLTAKYIQNLKCPLKGNVTLRKFPIMLHMAQGLLANGDYLLTMLLSKKELIILDANISFTVSPSKFGV